MATFNKPIATNQGIALLKAEVAGTDSITFTKTVFSSDDYSQTADIDIANLTAIQSMDLTTNAQTFQDVNGNTKVRAIGYNNSVNQAFYIKTYALYAKNKAGNEILFAVASSQTADFVPAFNNAQLTQISYTFTFAIDQTSNITLSDQHEITVTQADIASINNAVNSNASSLSSSMSNVSNSLSSSIANNLSEITSLNMNALQYYGLVPTNTLADISKDGMYNLAGRQYTDGPYQGLIWGTIIQFGTQAGVQSQIILTNFGTMYFRAINSWGIEGWFPVAKGSDVTALQNSLSANISNNSSSISSLSSSAGSAISSNSANIASNASAISSNANSTSSAISSVSSSNNAVSSSIASTVSVNQSNIANNSSSISSLSSSASSAIGSNATNIANNSSAINSLVSSASSAIGSNATNIANNSSAINSLTSAQSSAVSSLASKAVTYSGFVPVFDDLNNYTTPGIYDMRGSTYDTINNSYYQGIGITLTVTSGGGAINQTIFSIRDDGRPQVNIRTLQKMGQWTRWYLQPTLDDINDKALVFRGNLPSTHLADITLSGIYNMGGIKVDDGPYPIQWGQLAVLNTGGVINQTIHDSSGTLFTRSINSWGIVGWNTNKH